MDVRILLLLIFFWLHVSCKHLNFARDSNKWICVKNIDDSVLIKKCSTYTKGQEKVSNWIRCKVKLIEELCGKIINPNELIEDNQKYKRDNGTASLRGIIQEKWQKKKGLYKKNEDSTDRNTFATPTLINGVLSTRMTEISTNGTGNLKSQYLSNQTAFIALRLINRNADLNKKVTKKPKLTKNRTVIYQNVPHTIRKRFSNWLQKPISVTPKPAQPHHNDNYKNALGTVRIVYTRSTRNRSDTTRKVPKISTKRHRKSKNRIRINKSIIVTPESTENSGGVSQKANEISINSSQNSNNKIRTNNPIHGHTKSTRKRGVKSRKYPKISTESRRKSKNKIPTDKPIIVTAKSTENSGGVSQKANEISINSSQKSNNKIRTNKSIYGLTKSTRKRVKSETVTKISTKSPKNSNNTNLTSNPIFGTPKSTENSDVTSQIFPEISTKGRPNPYKHTTNKPTSKLGSITKTLTKRPEPSKSPYPSKKPAYVTSASIKQNYGSPKGVTQESTTNSPPLTKLNNKVTSSMLSSGRTLSTNQGDNCLVKTSLPPEGQNILQITTPSNAKSVRSILSHVVSPSFALFLFGVIF